MITRTIKNNLAIFGGLLLLGMTAMSQEQPVKCGFAELLQHRGVAKLAAPQARPEMQHRYLTQDGRFLIHYDLTGSSAIDPQSTNSLGIPDYIYEADKALHKAYLLIADSLGFSPPPPDNVGYPEDPPGGAQDIYIVGTVPLASYGMTYWEDLVSSEPEAYTSYSLVDNNFEGSQFYTHGIDALRVTLAHELFHQFHIGYVLNADNIVPDTWWYELTSSWFEDVAYPAVNDYAQYVKGYFNSPKPLDESNGYETAHYGFVLSGYGEPLLWEAMWSAFKDVPPYEAIDEGLQRSGRSFAQSYQRFAAWNLLTGGRAIEGVGYADADLFPEIAINGEITIPDSLPAKKTFAPKTAGYYEVFNGNAPQFYQMKFAGSGFLKGALALAGDTEPFREFSAGQSLGANLNYANYNGVMAIVNGGEATATITIDQDAKILRPFPNPFVRGDNSQLNLYTVLTEKSPVTLHIFNILGQKVYTTHFGNIAYEIGPQTLSFPMDTGKLKALSSGVYFLQLQSDGSLQTAKFVLIQ